MLAVKHGAAGPPRFRLWPQAPVPHRRAHSPAMPASADSAAEQRRSGLGPGAKASCHRSAPARRGPAVHGRSRRRDRRQPRPSRTVSARQHKAAARDQPPACRAPAVHGSWPAERCEPSTSREPPCTVSARAHKASCHRSAVARRGLASHGPRASAKVRAETAVGPAVHGLGLARTRPVHDRPAVACRGPRCAWVMGQPKGESPRRRPARGPAVSAGCRRCRQRSPPGHRRLTRAARPKIAADPNQAIDPGCFAGRARQAPAVARNPRSLEHRPGYPQRCGTSAPGVARTSPAATALRHRRAWCASARPRGAQAWSWLPEHDLEGYASARPRGAQRRDLVRRRPRRIEEGFARVLHRARLPDSDGDRVTTGRPRC